VQTAAFVRHCAPAFLGLSFLPSPESVRRSDRKPTAWWCWTSISSTSAMRRRVSAINMARSGRVFSRALETIDRPELGCTQFDVRAGFNRMNPMALGDVDFRTKSWATLALPALRAVGYPHRMGLWKSFIVSIDLWSTRCNTLSAHSLCSWCPQSLRSPLKKRPSYDLNARGRTSGMLFRKRRRLSKMLTGSITDSMTRPSML
jgi:hypothetical protein